MNLIITALALLAFSLIIYCIVGIVKKEMAERQAAADEEAYIERWSRWGDVTRVGP